MKNSEIRLIRALQKLMKVVARDYGFEGHSPEELLQWRKDSPGSCGAVARGACIDALEAIEKAQVGDAAKVKSLQ